MIRSDRHGQPGIGFYFEKLSTPFEERRLCPLDTPSRQHFDRLTNSRKLRDGLSVPVKYGVC